MSDFIVSYGGYHEVLQMLEKTAWNSNY